MRSPLWTLADQLGVVPLKPDAVVRARIQAWWQHRITRACEHPAGTVSWVVWPDLRVWCGACAVDALNAERACVYCTREDVDESGTNVVAESAFGLLVLFGRAHAECAEEAAR